MDGRMVQEKCRLVSPLIVSFDDISSLGRIPIFPASSKLIFLFSLVSRSKLLKPNPN